MTIHSVSLQQAFNPKKNSFGFLRFFFAVLVIFSHCHPLGGFAVAGIFGSNQKSYGDNIAVCCFFIVSGFLITRSYVQSQSLWHFLQNRVLRIFPAFWACLFLTILIFAPIIHFAEYGSLQNYFQFQPENPLDYFKVNFFLEIKQYNINQLLKKLPFPGAFNGSLWSLVYEFRCYLAVAILGWLGILSKQRFIVLSLFVSFWALHILNIVVPGAAAKVSPYFLDIQNLELSLYFLAGSVSYLYASAILTRLRLFVFILAVLVLSLKYQFYPVLSPFLLSYAVFCAAIYLPFSGFGKYGDFSYGLYIYAFPVQQTLTFFGYNRYGFSIYFMLSLALTLFFSIGSWFLVEKPCLNLKSISPRLKE